MTITAQLADPVSLAAQAAADAPDGPAAAMVTARHLHDTARHLAAASGHLDAAREAPPSDQDGHLGKCAAILGGPEEDPAADTAYGAAHRLASHLRASYPDEGAELDKLTGTVGLAVSVSDQARTATTAHLAQTTCSHLAHTIRHVQAMQDDPKPKVREFNGEHARTHLDGALEHVGKLARHLKSNYPAEAKHLAEAKHPAELKGSGTVSAQMAEPVTVSGQAARSWPDD